jgi:hypothetical protein
VGLCQTKSGGYVVLVNFAEFSEEVKPIPKGIYGSEYIVEVIEKD